MLGILVVFLELETLHVIPHCHTVSSWSLVFSEQGGQELITGCQELTLLLQLGIEVQPRQQRSLMAKRGYTMEMQGKI